MWRYSRHVQPRGQPWVDPKHPKRDFISHPAWECLGIPGGSDWEDIATLHSPLWPDLDPEKQKWMDEPICMSQSEPTEWSSKTMLINLCLTQFVPSPSITKLLKGLCNKVKVSRSRALKLQWWGFSPMGPWFQQKETKLRTVQSLSLPCSLPTRSPGLPARGTVGMTGCFFTAHNSDWAVLL